MIKSILFLLSFTIFLIPSFPTENVQAQAVQGTVSYQCTEAVRCSTDEDNENCQPVGDDDVHESRKWEHRVQIDLSSLNFPPNTDIYLTECLSMGEDLNGDGKAEPVCTTGDSTLDKVLFCGDANDTRESCDHLDLLEKKGYTLNKNTYGIYHLVDGVYVSAPNLVIKSGETGKSLITKVEWQSYTQGMEERRYQAWYRTPEPTPTPTTPALSGTPVISPGSGGQQQAILTFPAGNVPQEVPPPANCEGISWDPYGYVFDMKSLEPIPDAEVLLSMKQPNGTFDAAYAVEQNFLISNPFGTSQTGQFTFFVRDGDYKLTPSKTGYSHPASSEQSNLLPNATKVYSQNIYYNDSPEIQQRGSIQRRDIPMMPVSGVGQTYELVRLIEDIELNTNGRLTYSGKVSHPYSELVFEVCKKVNGAETCKEPTIYTYLNGGPNKFGNFSITVDQKLLESGEYYNSTFRKVDLTTMTISKASPIKKVFEWLFAKLQPGVVQAQETSNRAIINPIMSYVEGFAYDIDGNLLPNATVNIIVPMSETPVYQVQASAQGYYKITSEFLPKIEYAIQYIPAGLSVTQASKITSSQFLTQNSEFIELESINPYLLTTASNDPRRNVIPTYVPPSKIVSLSSDFKDTNIEQPETTMAPDDEGTKNKNTSLIIGIFLLLFATIGAVIGVYFYKKRMKQNELE